MNTRGRRQRVPSAYSQGRRHGLSAEQINAMGANQGWRCLLCGKDISEKYVVDHDHTLAALHPHDVNFGCAKCVRGLLDSGCNSALGAFKDDPELLRRAAHYIELARGLA